MLRNQNDNTCPGTACVGLYAPAAGVLSEAVTWDQFTVGV